MILKKHFTLVELVCAMLVMMVVALVIGTAGSSFYNGYRRSNEAVAKLKERMAIDRVWDAALVNMVPFKWKDDNNETRYVFEGKNDELLLTTLRRVYGNDPSALTLPLLFPFVKKQPRSPRVTKSSFRSYSSSSCLAASGPSMPRRNSNSSALSFTTSA